MRITEKMLQCRVDYLNKLSGFENHKYSQIGSYALSFAYGGVSLHKYGNECGGVHNVFNCGYITKRDLYDRINAFISGYTEIKLKGGAKWVKKQKDYY